MEKRILVMEWHYTYDKEGYWFDEEDGVEEYALEEGASYPLPHIGKKCLEIRSVTVDGDTVKAELYADYRTYLVVSGGEPVAGSANYDYSVAGDCVSETLTMKFTIK